MSNAPRLILLDTHIWLWSQMGAGKALSPELKALIEKMAEDSAIRVSAISVWEIGTLVAKNRISFVTGLKEWVYRALEAPGIRLETIDAEIALESTLLESFHGDPADRILLATAKKIGATLITYDKKILSYSKKYDLPALSY